VDNKLIAALVIAVIGVGTGITGIVMANDAKGQNDKTQKALAAAIAAENRGVAAEEARAEGNLNRLGKKVESEAGRANKQVEGEVATAEQQIKAESQKSSGQLSSIQNSVNSLSDQLSTFESGQRATNQKLNARITALAQRINSGG